MEGGDVVYKELSYKIMGIMFGVFNELGYGYNEKHYERAVEKSFIMEGVKFRRQLPFKIMFKEHEIGKYYFDFLIEDKIIVELKKGDYFAKRNIEQAKEYLKVTGLKLAIIVNFTSNGVKSIRILNPYNK